MNLSASEMLAVKSGSPVPVLLDDTECVVVRKDVYERVQQILAYDGGEWTHEELQAMLSRSTAANGWDEPEMDAYDRYDEELRKRCP